MPTTCFSHISFLCRLLRRTINTGGPPSFAPLLPMQAPHIPSWHHASLLFNVRAWRHTLCSRLECGHISLILSHTPSHGPGRQSPSYTFAFFFHYSSTPTLCPPAPLCLACLIFPFSCYAGCGFLLRLPYRGLPRGYRTSRSRCPCNCLVMFLSFPTFGTLRTLSRCCILSHCHSYGSATSHLLTLSPASFTHVPLGYT